MPYDTNVMMFVTNISKLLVSNNAKEIPVVAALVRDGKIVALSSNDVENTGQQWRHAEFCVIEMGVSCIKDKFLCDCDIYVTLEPCSLCMEVINSVRVRSVYFGAYNTKYGSLFNCKYRQKANVIGGFFEVDNAEVMSKYFNSMRNL